MVRSTQPARRSAQDHRLAWIHELVTGTSESLPYCVAGMLLLLHAQPLVKLVTFSTNVFDDGDSGMSISLGRHPTDVPEPFASLVREHLVAEGLGYSAKVAFLHGDKGAEPWARYAGRRIADP